MAIGEVCNREVVIAERTTSIPEAAQLMRQHHVGDLVVVESRGGKPHPVGIVTDRDIVLEVVAPAVDLNSLVVGDIMTAEPATVREAEGVFETLRYMRDRAVRRLPVTDGDGALVGIIAVDDLLELLAEELGDLAKLLGRERQREAKSRQ